MKLVKNCVDIAPSSSAQSFCVNLNNHHNQNHAFLFCRFEGFACKFLCEWFFMAFCQADEDGFHKLLENGCKIAVGTTGRSFAGSATEISQNFGPFRIECQSSGLTLVVSCVTSPRSCPFNANTDSSPEIEFN